MEILIYGLIFIIGTLFGSFFTLAVYRIPLGKNILYKHSSCPKCGEKLKFKDLIPIFSYIFLRGKCAYCGQKIRIRYLLLEVLSGIVFLAFALSFRINFFEIDLRLIIIFMLYILYIASLFIIAGIDKENIKIQKSLLIFGMAASSCYIIYACVQQTQAIYTYIIYLVLTLILVIADTIFMRSKLRESYVIGVLFLILYMIVFSGEFLTYLTIILGLLCAALQILALKLKESSKRKSVIETKKNIKMPLGFYLCSINIVLIILSNFVGNWVMR